MMKETIDVDSKNRIKTGTPHVADNYSSVTQTDTPLLEDDADYPDWTFSWFYTILINGHRHMTFNRPLSLPSLPRLSQFSVY